MRLNIEISEKKMHHLEDLMQHVEIETKKELFNTAIALFEWAVIERSKGNVIASLNEETGDYKELLILALEQVRPISYQAINLADLSIGNEELMKDLLASLQAHFSVQDIEETELEHINQLETELVAGD